MLIEQFIVIAIGVLVGSLTGVTPGIHLNLVALLTFSVAPVLLQYISLPSLCIFIIAMSITHTFVDAVPGMYLGAPSEAEALSVLPGHRMLLKGLGHQAVLCTIM